MRNRLNLTCLFAACAALLQCQPVNDPRHISNGSVIPDESYSDQPYVVKTDDGAWLCVMTTGKGAEGQGGQHVVSLRSTKRGRTWEPAVDVEPSDGPEASYAVLLKVPGGRVYVFYNHNTDNIREVAGDKPAYKDGINRRVDSLGHFVFKYSDDHGKSWSPQRRDIPQRDFEIDRKNPYGGKLKFFWNVGKPFIHRGAGYVPLHKVGGFGAGFFTSSEGVLLRSSNILTERDPAKIAWETLPDGEKGIRAPAGIGGPIAEEQSFSELSDGSIFCVFRTIDGHSAFTYSRDGGRTWEPTEYMRFASGRLMKHPRAANFAWRCENGRYLYWFHNHGGRFIREHPNRRSMAYEDRNPVWLSGGVEADSPRGKVIRWSEPEIALYDDDPMIRMSYPDLIEDGGEYYVTETQKDVARVHQLDRRMLEGLWSSGSMAPPRDAIWTSGSDAPLPPLPLFLRRSTRADHGTERLRNGVTLDVWLSPAALNPGDVLLSNDSSGGRGFTLQVAPGGAVELRMNDGRTGNSWRSEAGVLTVGRLQHLAVVIDGGPNIVTFISEGRLLDGGDVLPFGWGRFSPFLYSISGSEKLALNRSAVVSAQIFARALRTAEAIALYRAGPPTTPPRP